MRDVRSRFDGVAGLDPGVEATEDGLHVREAMTFQDLRRTGAGLFIRSGAVGDDPLRRVQLGEAGLEVRGGDGEGAGDMAGGIGFGGARIDEHRGAGLVGRVRVGEADAVGSRFRGSAARR